jgi:hypothetical protein
MYNGRHRAVPFALEIGNGLTLTPKILGLVTRVAARRFGIAARRILESAPYGHSTI